MKLRPRSRELTEVERRLLAATAHHLRFRSARARRARWVAGALVLVPLWLVTLLVSDAPWPFVTVFWLVAGGAIALWVRHDPEKDRRYRDAMASALESALG